MLNFLQRHASFAFLMAFVIGWSSVAFAMQKPIHQQMMNKTSFLQANTVSAEVLHARSKAQYADVGLSSSQCTKPTAYGFALSARFATDE